MKTYTEENKRTAVDLARQIGFKAAAKKLKVNFGTLYKWRRDLAAVPAPRVEARAVTAPASTVSLDFLRRVWNEPTLPEIKKQTIISLVLN